MSDKELGSLSSLCKCHRVDRQAKQEDRYQFLASKSGHKGKHPKRTSSKELRGKKDRKKGKDKNENFKDKRYKGKSRWMHRTWDRATQNLEALVVGLSVLPCPGIPEIPEIVKERLEPGFVPSSEPTPEGSSGSSLHQGQAHGASSAASTSSGVEQPCLSSALRERAVELSSQMQAIQTETLDKSADMKCQDLWTLWSSAEVLLVDARKGSCQASVSQKDYSLIIADVVGIASKGAQFIRVMFCDKDRPATVEAILPLHRWVEESLRALQRLVECVAIHASELYDVEDTKEAAALEETTAGLCRLLYELCLDVIWHIYDMGDVESSLQYITNMDGMVLIEGLAYKVIALVLDMMKSTFFDHWTFCWKFDGGELLFQIEEACSQTLRLIGMNEEVANTAELQTPTSIEDEQVSLAMLSMSDQSSMSTSFSACSAASELISQSRQSSSDKEIVHEASAPAEDAAVGWFFNRPPPCPPADGMASIDVSKPPPSLTPPKRCLVDLEIAASSTLHGFKPPLIGSIPEDVIAPLEEEPVAAIHGKEAPSDIPASPFEAMQEPLKATGEVPKHASRGLPAEVPTAAGNLLASELGSTVASRAPPHLGRSLSVDILQVPTLNDSDLEIKRMLGTGSFGLVFLAKSLKDDSKTALKIIKDLKRGHDGRPVPADKWESFKREWAACRNLSHRNIVRFNRVVWFITSSQQAQRQRLNPEVPHLCIEMEYCSLGNLEKLLHKAMDLSHTRKEKTQPRDLTDYEKQAAKFSRVLELRLRIAYQVASALDHMHSHGVVHRDLRPTNIVLTLERANSSEGGVKLIAKVCDFGACRTCKDKQRNAAHDDVVSPKYQAPEVLEGKNYGSKSDVFSFGVVLWQLVTMREAWEDTDTTYVVCNVPRGERLELPSPDETHFIRHDALIGLMSRCWETTEGARPGMHEVARELRRILEEARAVNASHREPNASRDGATAHDTGDPASSRREGPPAQMEPPRGSSVAEERGGQGPPRLPAEARQGTPCDGGLGDASGLERDRPRSNGLPGG